jgi:hypothetical protein
MGLLNCLEFNSKGGATILQYLYIDHERTAMLLFSELILRV